MRFAWWLAPVVCGAAVSTTAACTNDDTTPQQGSGNDVVGIDATTQAAQSDDGGPDSPFARVDGGYPGKPDGYDPIGICAKCACPATDYCFGGGTGYTTFGGSCKPTAFGIGCQPIPDACASVGDASVCDCLLQATASKVGCYGVCVDTTQTVYCPNP
jgi:hypothetical protein